MVVEAGDAETSGLLDDDESAAFVALTAAPKLYSCRYKVAALAGLGYVLCYAQRLVLPIGIVQMQNEFGWSKLEQGQLLGSFFIGCEWQPSECPHAARQTD